MENYELRSVDGDVNSLAADNGMTQHNRDNLVLAKLGKKQVLRRNFGFLSMLGFSCTVMITWEGVLLLLAVNFTNGGFAGSVYGYIFVWLGVMTSFATMAELASMAPTAGGQYHWVSILAPARYRIFLSYVIGWLTMTGWQAIVASGGFLCAQLIQGLVALANPNYSGEPWQTMLLYWAAIAFALFVNTVIGRLLPKVEGLILIIHIFGFIAILVPLVYFAPHATAAEVFQSFQNGGMWPADGISFFIGILGPAFSLLGPDGTVHMSEEITKPALNVPRAIVYGILLNGLMGFGMLIAALYCTGGDVSFFSETTVYPFMAIFKNAVVNLPGALAMSAMIVIMNIFATISFVATASRMTWSFARDRGPPGWKKLGSVEPRTTLPMWSIGLTLVISILLSLVILGSPIAFNDFVSLSINGLYASYLIGNTLLLWRRVTGQVKPYDPDSKGLTNTIGVETLTWGPWRIPEPLGTINNALGCIYMLIVFFFSFWPLAINPTPSQMNYSVLMVGAVSIFSMVYYTVRARHIYTGPVVEIEI